MLFHSRLDPTSKSDRPLIVLCHEHDRVLVPLPQTVEEAQQVARQEFSLAGDIQFETDDLQGCEGLAVRIHPDAWDGIISLLRSISVRSTQQQSPQQPRASSSIHARKSAPRTSVSATPSRRVSQVTPSKAPSRRTSRAPSAVIAAVRENRRKSGRPSAPIEVPDSRPAHAHIVEHHEEELHAHIEEQHEEEEDTAPEKEQVDEFEADDVAPEAEAADEEAEVDEVEEEVILSSPKKRAARQRVLSDYGLEDGAATTSEWPPKEHAVAESGSARPDRNSKAGTPSAGSQKGSGSVKGGPFTKTPSASKASRASALWEEPEAGPSCEAEDNKPEVKQKPASFRPEERPGAPKAEEKPASHKSDKVEVSPRKPQTAPKTPARSDEAFLISIEYSEDPDSCTLFKTRGRHLVSKVLMQACRTFGIEEDYENTQLVLLIEDEEEGTQLRSVCDPDETMARAGAQPQARFLVELVGDDLYDDELLEEDSM